MLIDIHHHLVHGLDDGAQTFEDTQRMLKMAKKEGVRHIISTSHACPGREPFELQRYYDHLKMAQDWCQEQQFPIEIHPGTEIFYTPDTLRFLNENKIPTLAGTRHVLLEFSPQVSFEYLRSAAKEIRWAGYLPVFAHVERYRCLHRFYYMKKLHDEYQVIMQMNARTVLASVGFFEACWRRRVLEKGMIDIIASDAHNTKTRRCCLGACYDKLTREYGEEIARRLCIDTPQSIMDKNA